MIRRCRFERVLAAVRASGVAAELEDLVNHTRTGRPRTLSVEVYLTAAILCAGTYQSTTQTAIHRLLTCGLARSLRIRHGLLVDGVPVSIDQVRYLLNAITSHLTPDGDVPDGGEQRILDQIVDRIVSATIPDRFATPRAVAMDATAVKSFARGKRRTTNADPATDPDTAVVETGPAADPDASWGYCTRTQDNASRRVFGYHAYTLVGVPGEGQQRDAMPKLTVRLRLRTANADVVEPGLALISAAAEAADAASTPALKTSARLCLMADMAWSYKLAERWAIPARALGADLVFDLHPNDRGARVFDGVLMVDGYPHCPALPEHLHNITRPERLKVGDLPANPTWRQARDHARATAALARFKELIAERDLYAFRRIAGPDPTGKERFQCPAQAGKVRCANCPLSEFLDNNHPDVVDPPPADAAPVACRQQTTTIPGHVDAKRRQRLRWGTEAWIGLFCQRTYVEGTYGSMKASTGGNVRRGWCHARRHVKVALLLACAIAASNLALLRTWAARTGNHELPYCEPDPPDHGFEELDADGNINPAPGPEPPGTA